MLVRLRTLHGNETLQERCEHRFNVSCKSLCKSVSADRYSCTAAIDMDKVNLHRHFRECVVSRDSLVVMSMVVV